MYIVTGEEMREIERIVIEDVGIPAIVLMENAGRAIAEEAAAIACSRANQQGIQPFRWLILVGKGNNGGDGIVCARHLLELGCEAELLYAQPPEQLRGDAAKQRDIARSLGIPELLYNEHAADAIPCNQWDGIIDALLGTGTIGEPREPFASLIHAANVSGLPIVSADIPSGLQTDTGHVPAACIRAHTTVALSQAKRGLLLYPGAEAAGNVIVRAIGIPEQLVQQAGVHTYRLDADTLRKRHSLELPLARKQDTHKGSYGHVLVIAGSAAMSGAGLLCTHAALRGGSGLVSWALPAGVAARLLGCLPEAMLHGIADRDTSQWSSTQAADLLQLAAGKQAAVIGPGLGRWAGDSAWLHQLLRELPCPLVVDADGLNMLADANSEPSPFDTRNIPTILTPHPGEMARLMGLTTAEVQRDRIGAASHYATTHQVIVVLKGARTIVALPNGDVYINMNGNPGMSTGGSGDVLAGLMGSLLAQGLSAAEAALLAVYWHGAAGDRAAMSRQQASLIASDIIEAL